MNISLVRALQENLGQIRGFGEEERGEGDNSKPGQRQLMAIKIVGV